MAIDENEELNVPENEGTGAENEGNNEEEVTTPTEGEGTGEVDPADDPAVIVDFNDFTAVKMKTLAEKAAEIDDPTHIDMLTSQILNRVKAQASKALTTLTVLYASATMDFKEEYREAVKNKLLSLGYTVVEDMDEDVPIGITITWEE